jgi:hypothetical protein
VVDLLVIDTELALERVLESGDEWQSWRALRLSGEEPGDIPQIPKQEAEGGFFGPGGHLSPGATGEALCRFVVLGLGDSGAAAIAADWLESVRTPAQAWLDSPAEYPGDLDTPAATRVWATASAACGLLAAERDPGSRAFDLLRGEADTEGRFTGGAYPTFAAAGAYWLAQGPKTEMAEWALRWSREWIDEWDPGELADALTFWGAARIPPENLTVEMFLAKLRDDAPTEGWPEPDLTLDVLELLAFYT